MTRQRREKQQKLQFNFSFVFHTSCALVVTLLVQA
jgi:hypothetical protein